MGGGNMGEDLLTQLLAATGLPQDLIAREVADLITAAGAQPEDLTLDQLRDIVANYLQEVMVQAKLRDGSEAEPNT